MKIEIGSNVTKLVLINIISMTLVGGVNYILRNRSNKKYIDKLRAGIVLCDEYIDANKDTLSEKDIEDIRNEQMKLRIELMKKL